MLIFLFLLFLLLAFVLGLCVGSFLNAVEFRMAHGKRIVRTAAGVWERSRCPNCHLVLRPRELVPIFSFLFLRGKCRSCTQPISWQYPAIELLCGIFFAAVAARYGVSVSTAVILVETSFLVFLFLYDLKHQLIPDRVVLPAIIISTTLSLVLGAHPFDLLLGAAIAGGFFLMQFMLSRGRWIGGGDIRLGVLMGVMLGWERTVAALFIAYVLGAVFALILLAKHRAALNTRLPFGTFLTAATFFALLHGRALIEWYIGLLHLA